MADNPHIFVNNPATAFPFTSPILGFSKSDPPPRNRAEHSARIKLELERAWGQAHQEQEAARRAVAIPTRSGTYLEFESTPGCDLQTKSLESLRTGIRLVNVREVTPSAPPADEERQLVTMATVYIPKGKENYFLEKVRQYAEEDNTQSGKAKNRTLIESIEGVHLALVESFWTDDKNLFPGTEPITCEIWLASDKQEAETAFRGIAQGLGITVQMGSLHFPERTVVLANVNREQLGQLTAASDNLAEFRRARTTADFWTGLPNDEQVDWARNLRDRLEVSPDTNVAVSVLDTGANNGHILLAPILDGADCLSCEPDWGVDDHEGHGTLMCGLAEYGDLQQALEGDETIHFDHRLESVKILPPNGEGNAPESYGYRTSQAVSRVEIQAPERTHVHCMAVTSEEGRRDGSPTAWSAALDALAAGEDIGRLAPGAVAPDAEPVAAEKRLIIVSAGNVEDSNDWTRYPESNLARSVQDPAQSWNALTVGAYTQKTFLSDLDLAGYQPVAPLDGLSPFSTTSIHWDKKWPAKPDILMEGGNVIRDPSGLCETCEDTLLLSTSRNPTERQFGTIGATSAATAQAACMAARIQALYPQAWPETVRGLMVHSAEWTEQMKSSFVPEAGGKTDYAQLLKICGYGVPNLQRALWCASNSLTLIVQDTLQPFDKKSGGGACGSKDMHLHRLPWPKDVLENLGEADVTLRITLSYFIEPSPGEIGWKERYRYQSHALRFDLNAPLEDERSFLARKNKEAREEGEAPENAPQDAGGRWKIGSQGRSHGSIHSDMWTGPAVELAACNLVGVYPVIGWWRERSWLNSWNKQARYSLIVSLDAPEIDVDIYTPVAQQVANLVPIPTR